MTVGGEHGLIPTSQGVLFLISSLGSGWEKFEKEKKHHHLEKGDLKESWIFCKAETNKNIQQKMLLKLQF